MIDHIKDFLDPKAFSVVAYVCVIGHACPGAILTLAAKILRDSEKERFSCSVDGQSTASYKKYVDQACSLRYDQTYNSPLPLYGFVSLSIGLSVLISIIYSLVVKKRVDEIESNHERQTVGETDDHTHNRRAVCVFYSYFVHLVLRAFLGIIFTVLQHVYFYPNGFDLEFSCKLPTDRVSPNVLKTPKNVNRNSTSSTCENATASEKSSIGKAVCVLNSIVVFIIFAEVIYLLLRFLIPSRHNEVGRNIDYKFVIEYIFGKDYNEPERQPLRSIENNSPDLSGNQHTVNMTQDYSTDNSIQETSNQSCSAQNYNHPQDYISLSDNNFQDYQNFYKQEVKTRSRAFEINYIENISLDDMYIDVVIQTERAPHKFSKDMERHEIYDVYMKVPSNSIRLGKIKDLFYPNKDTKDLFPRSILVIGRPGIGKTVLTEKILCDWANEADEFYRDKTVFDFKLRWFNDSKFGNISLKTFLQFGTRLETEKFESIYQKIVSEPQKAILIFDGLDEFNGTPVECLDQSSMIANDRDRCMSAMSLFIKLVRGEMLKGATVLVTSRPTADDFYWKLNFSRNVEIIGFTSDKIEEYVSRFCKNKNKSDNEQTIWNHIKSSSELLNLCYIPVNCLILCTTLNECLNDLENDTNVLPKTLTELYEIALHYVGKKHQRNADANYSAQGTLKKLQRLAFNGMKARKLLFNHELFDEQMKASGLLNHLSNGISQDQFCFTHLTIQEFLAAKHVTDTFAQAEIKTFISDHIRIGKWHLVLQFIAGLLGKKIKMFDKEYKNCIAAFVGGFKLFRDNSDHKMLLYYNEVCVLKCLREIDDEEIIKDVCNTTVLNDVSVLCTAGGYDLSSSEWAAVTAVCKHMKNVVILELNDISKDSFQSVRELLEKRCIRILDLVTTFDGDHVDAENVFSALTKVNCALEHGHSELTTLTLTNFQYGTSEHDSLENMCTFFKKGRGRHLTVLGLDLTSNACLKLCEMFNSECCPELTTLLLGGNFFRDTEDCIPALINALQDKLCRLTLLALELSNTGDKGASMLFENALTNQNCKITELHLKNCFLTCGCVPALVKALQHKRCRLTVLTLERCEIDNEGTRMLIEKALTNENCKLTELYLNWCSLTDDWVPTLVGTLQDERCRLTKLYLFGNSFTENGKRELRNVEEFCKDRCMRISKYRGLRIYL